MAKTIEDLSKNIVEFWFVHCDKNNVITESYVNVSNIGSEESDAVIAEAYNILQDIADFGDAEDSKKAKSISEGLFSMIANTHRLNQLHRDAYHNALSNGATKNQAKEWAYRQRMAAKTKAEEAVHNIKANVPVGAKHLYTQDGKEIPGNIDRNKLISDARKISVRKSMAANVNTDYVKPDSAANSTAPKYTPPTGADLYNGTHYVGSRVGDDYSGTNSMNFNSSVSQYGNSTNGNNSRRSSGSDSPMSMNIFGNNAHLRNSANVNSAISGHGNANNGNKRTTSYNRGRSLTPKSKSSKNKSTTTTTPAPTPAPAIPTTPTTK
jgi:hypothetical protein